MAGRVQMPKTTQDDPVIFDGRPFSSGGEWRSPFIRFFFAYNARRGEARYADALKTLGTTIVDDNGVSYWPMQSAEEGGA